MCDRTYIFLVNLPFVGLSMRQSILLTEYWIGQHKYEKLQFLDVVFLSAGAKLQPAWPIKLKSRQH